MCQHLTSPQPQAHIKDKKQAVSLRKVNNIRHALFLAFHTTVSYNNIKKYMQHYSYVAVERCMLKAKVILLLTHGFTNLTRLQIYMQWSAVIRNVCRYFMKGPWNRHEGSVNLKSLDAEHYLNESLWLFLFGNCWFGDFGNVGLPLRKYNWWLWKRWNSSSLQQRLATGESLIALFATVISDLGIVGLPLQTTMPLLDCGYFSQVGLH